FYNIKDDAGVRKPYPAVGRSQLAEQVPAVKKKFLRYKDYATASVDDIINAKTKANGQVFTCYETRSCWFENRGKGVFVQQVLPVAAQFAPVNAIIAADIDGDGIKDLVLAGNEYQADVMTGRYDASYGLLLKGSSNGRFTAIPMAGSGLALRGDIRSMLWLPGARGQQYLIAAANSDSLQVYKLNQAKR
ncbi:MAG TPA: VCBS repeat-containing protein, partial [Chitinophagaceae bacterium]|nr:VCBS repeat-containing protein [Chitinophagaceae bacterium]